jgi:DNA polymerase III subunit delta
MSERARAILVKGADPALVAQAAHRTVELLLEGRDANSCVEEHGGSAADELDVARVVDALLTPPFLTDRRVVVVRDAGRLSPTDAERLIPVLEALPDGVAVVLVGGGGTLPPSLAKAVSASGEVIDATIGASIRDRRAFVATEVRRGPVRLDAAAAESLLAHLGEDLSRLDGVLETLAAAYGEGATIGIEELAPFLGATGSVPEWDLTDAIVSGDAATSLGVLQRLLGPGGRAAPLVVSSLQRHYLRLLRLDGSGVRTKDAAAALLKVSAFPAGKLLAAASSLGAARIRQAVAWIAGADEDVKGATALEPAIVLEILVARLARLHRAAGVARPSERGAGR